MVWYIWVIVVGGLLALIFASLKLVKRCRPGATGSTGLMGKALGAALKLFQGKRDGSEAGDSIDPEVCPCKVGCSQ